MWAIPSGFRVPYSTLTPEPGIPGVDSKPCDQCHRTCASTVSPSASATVLDGFYQIERAYLRPVEPAKRRGLVISVRDPATIPTSKFRDHAKADDHRRIRKPVRVAVDPGKADDLDIEPGFLSPRTMPSVTDSPDSDDRPGRHHSAAVSAAREDTRCSVSRTTAEQTSARLRHHE